MKGPLFLISLLTLLLYSCDNYENISSSQADSFIKYYALNQANTGVGICELPDGGYVLLGNTETVQHGTDICLIFTDEFGNSIQQPKFIGGPKNERGYCIKQAPDGGFIILGSKESDSREDKDVYLIRTDRLGVIIWDTIFDAHGKDDEGYWFDTNENGDIMMVGYASSATKQAWHYIVDQHGNQIDAFGYKEHGWAAEADEARYVQHVSDGWLVTGVLINGNEKYPVWFISEDWQSPKVSYVSELDEEYYATAVLNDLTFYLCGSVTDAVGGSSDILLFKVNKQYTDGESFEYRKEWIKRYNNPGNDKGTSLLVEGNNLHILSTRSSGDKTSTISIITTTLEGENPQYESIGGSSELEGSTFNIAADGGFIISGTNHRKLNSSMTLIKTKAGGKL